MKQKVYCAAAESNPAVFILTLNNPDRLNALSPEMLRSFLDKLDELDRNDDCRVVVITGAGRGFCAGAELSAVNTGSKSTVQKRMGAMRALWTQIIPKMRSIRPAIIAAVNGPAAGGGFVIALGADIRIASPDASFHDAFIRIGVSACELGLSWVLPRLVGAAAAWEMMLTGRAVDAKEAKRLGLVFDVVPEDQLVEAAIAKGGEIAENTPFGVWMTREVMWSSLEAPSLDSAIAMETRTQMLALETEDQSEQITALVQRSKPTYANR